MFPHEVAFDCVDLLDSIVVSWSHEDDVLRVDLEVSLLPAHPNAVAPLPGERACFRRGELTFSGITEIRGLLTQTSGQQDRETGQTVDYDTVHCLRTNGDGRYYLEGEFGEVNLVAAPPTLRLSESEWTATGRFGV